MLQAGPFTAGKCPAALREASASRGNAQRRASSVCVSPEVSLTERNREAHGWVWMNGEACHALLRLPPALHRVRSSRVQKGVNRRWFLERE
jgi:hypothetical protein